MKKDDCTLTPKQLGNVRKYAEMILRDSGAYRTFPTPVDAIVEEAKLEVSRQISLDSSFLGRIYKTVREPARWANLVVKRAVDKVSGLLWREERAIVLDQTVHPKRQIFLSLHEVGHDYLPHQRKTFAFLEDSDAELDPETDDHFEREANVFASEVLFQLDQFQKDALDCKFGIQTPIDLSKRYGSSVYSALRRFVTSNKQPCALIVYNRPEFIVGSGLNMTLRRRAHSPKFIEQFGSVTWPSDCGPESFFMKHVPSRKFTSPRSCRMRDVNGEVTECFIEAFDSTYQVFFLLYPASVVTKKRPVVSLT